MADKAKYAGDMRTAVVGMIAAYNRAVELADLFKALEWTKEDFDGLLAGSDITSQDLFDAIEATRGLQQIYGPQAKVFMKLA